MVEIEKIVIHIFFLFAYNFYRSLLPIYNHPTIDDHTKDIMVKLFGDFLQQESQQPPPPNVQSIDNSMTDDNKMQIDNNNSLNEKSENISKIFNKENQSNNEDEDDTDKYLYGDIGNIYLK